ncbi:MAG TPA: hypothetical protein VNM37_28060, partial [Candidatus Dormibacteraeota bacterium]|nr:hypothetical protein [Candidatus Dormibacteraeota bacterium]
MQEIKFEAGLRLQSLREHAVHLEGRKKLTLRESSVVLPARLKSIKARDIAGSGEVRVAVGQNKPTNYLFAQFWDHVEKLCSDPS